ncbi:primosomal protein N' [Segnochrobactraceae bacterium EtOH-i3]
MNSRKACLLSASPAVVSVLVPVAIDGPYSYAVPDDWPRPAPGTIVSVPLGPRVIVGVVWDDPPDPAVPLSKLRPIRHRFDAPPIDRSLRAFVDWLARWTLSPRGMVLRMVLRAPEALDPEPTRPGVTRIGPAPERLTPARSRVLQFMEEGSLAWTKAGLAEAAGVSPSVIDGLVTSGTLGPVALPPPRAAADPDPDAFHPPLTAEQRGAADILIDTVKKRAFSVTLLEGITGSGKTEVFLEAVAEVVRGGGQALILMPEIALTNAILARFEKRFAARPAEWHSAVPPAQRARVWRATASGEARVVVGARSALFLPFRDPRLIVVDEEHDTAYKQADGVIYHARDMSVIRAREGGFPVILASATPSIESRVNADSGRYAHVKLTSRIPGAKPPEIDLIDLRRTGLQRGRWLSEKLADAARDTIGRGEQALFFLNRRGYAPLTLCGACGHRFQCPNCTAWLVDHRLRGHLRCHHCGHAEPYPESCPECGAVDELRAVGPGIERVAEEVNERFPDARCLVLSSDLGGGPDRLRRELDLVASGGVDIVIGTQLVAKGHNFPNLTLVGVVDADLGLSGTDPRAGERAFQLLSQVTGRSGRAAGTTGRGLIQTHDPTHPVMQALASGDPEAFYTAEIAARRREAMPPFGRLAAIVISAPTRPQAEAHARAFALACPDVPGIQVLGPAEAPIAVVRGRHRFRLLVHGPRSVDLQGFLRAWLAKAPPEREGVRHQVDVDPQSFL